MQIRQIIRVAVPGNPKVAQGDTTVLFLADVPDQVRVLTIYGKLKTGFRDASGNEFVLTVPDEPPPSPTASLAGPRDGALMLELGEGRPNVRRITRIARAWCAVERGSRTRLACSSTSGSAVTVIRERAPPGEWSNR